VSINNESFIRQCFSLAKKGRGFVSPNPFVGVVIVKNAKIIGKGFHKKYGAAHAEVNAFKNATENVTGATIFCNLEPCCHTNKQTPPCVPLIISNGIKKVVISNLDPNPSVNGKGVKQLQDAGIEVITGVLEDEGKEVNKFYFKFVTEKLPYITIKIAQSEDGFISKSVNEQTWLTGNEAVKFVHKQRTVYDVVLIGANTVKVDNPLLTVREAANRNPIRVIIDGSLSIPLNSKIINSADAEKTWIFTCINSDKKKIDELITAGVKVFQLDSDKNKIDLNDILKKLAEENITSLFIEGGADIFNQFITKKLFDEIIVLQSTQKLGNGVAGFDFENAENIKIIKKEKLGNDKKYLLKKRE